MQTTLSGRAPSRAPILMLLAFALIPFVALGAHGCRPQPAPPPSTPTVVSSWTDTAREVTSALRWAVPAARLLLTQLLPDATAGVVGRVLDVLADASQRLDTALSVYETRGGDACAVYAASGAVRTALLDLADALVDHGVALGVPLGRILDGASALVDNLVPRCAVSQSWASAGDHTNLTLRSIDARARARGVVLRRDLDAIRPPEASR